MYHKCINENHMMHEFLIYGVWQKEFFLSLGHFLHFYSPYNPKNHNFDKMKKTTTRDIIILYMCTINENHMMYVSWDMKHDRQTFLLFRAIFCPFTLLTTPKNQNFEKHEIKIWIYHHFKQEYQRLWSYAMPFLRYGTWWM